MSRLQKVDPKAFEDFQRLIKGYVAEMSSANDLKPFAPKTAGEGFSSGDIATKLLENKKGVLKETYKTSEYAEKLFLKNPKTKINGKLLVKVSNSLEEEKTQELELSC